MDIEQLRRYLDHPDEAKDWLLSWGVDDWRHAHANLVSMAAKGLTLDLLASMCDQFAEHLPPRSDPDRALNNLDLFVTAARSPLALGSLFERDFESLPILLRIFSASQYLSELLILDNQAYDLLRMTEGQPVARDTLVAELASEVDTLADDAAVMTALRRFKRRETLRISYGDIIRMQSVRTVTEQIAFVADAIVEASIRFARRRLEEKRGVPTTPDGRSARFVALGMGKLGGTELNYSSDIDLIFLYEADGKTNGPRSIPNIEFFERLSRDVVKLLAERTALGQAYRVDLRLRPEGERGPVVHSLERAMRYYDVMGRTWERQAYVKARAIGGDLDLGREFLKYLEPWIYRRYLGLADITGIKALKRRIEQRCIHEGDDRRNVKTGHGGIRDIEFVIQFLQLLNGGDLPTLRTGNTLEAITQLESVGCLNHQERTLLEKNYAFLRKLEHRLQIMFDLQTHLMPDDEREMRKLAIRMGYADAPGRSARVVFEADYENCTAINRKILDHLLHDAFPDDRETEPEVDLVLDPAPPPEQVAEVLGRYKFRDVKLAYDNLVALSTEKVRFLSTRRCRHFLASIAPGLLQAISATPDPDSTLTNLEKVSDSLGGKGVLWELFSFNPPTMKLYVEICSSSPFLSGILTSNPGMIDELMDSLVLNKLPTRDGLRAALADVARGAEDLDPILHSFKNTQQLRVGVRDILGKEDIQATTDTLSNIADVCLERIAEEEYEKLVEKWGVPTFGEGPRAGETVEMVLLAMGKLGGRELSYHSDLDVMFLYETDGSTAHRRSARRGETTNNLHFFSELGQRIIKIASRLGPYGRLYEVDPRLRPTGKSGALAITISEFTRYFAEGEGQLWERQALCKARVAVGTERVAAEAMEAVHQAAFGRPFGSGDAEAIREMRTRLEAEAAQGSLKRGPGGLVDIEFLVQMMQLKYGRRNPTVCTPNTLDGLARLAEAGYLSVADSRFFIESYRYLRKIESRLRLMNITTHSALPTEAIEMAKLAHGLGYTSTDSFLTECHEYLAENRRRFERLTAKG